MKLLVILIFGLLVVETLEEKNPSGPSGPPAKVPPSHHSHRPKSGPPQKTENEKEKGAGWGWNPPPALTYQQTSCVDLTTIARVPFDKDFFGKWRIWYITGETKYYYISNSRIFNGIYPTTQEELNSMCFAQMSAYLNNLQYNFGNGVAFTQNCTMIDGHVQCPTFTHQSTYDAVSDVDPFAAFVGHNSRIVATDNQTYVMFYICVDGSQASLELTTTTPYATPAAVAAFVEQAKIFGIPFDQLQLAQCTSAYKGPYTYPFENYPNGWSSENGWSNNDLGWGTTNGWNQNLPSNGWNSNPEHSGWNAQPNGWSNNHNNGWLAEKEAEEKAVSQNPGEEN